MVAHRPRAAQHGSTELERGELAVVAFTHLPSRRAHTHQIMQMCEAYADQGLATTLVVGSIAGEKRDVWKQYDVEPIFTMQSLHVPDLVSWIERTGIWFPEVAKVLVWRLTLMLFGLRFARWSLEHPDAVLYSRDALPLWLVSKTTRGGARRSYLEVHTRPSGTINTILHRDLARRIGGFVLVTAHLEQRLRAVGILPQRVLVAGDAVRLRRFAGQLDRIESRTQLGWPLDAFAVGYAGSLESLGQGKGIPTLVQAFSSLVSTAEGLDYRLALIGCRADQARDLSDRYGGGRLGDHLLAPGWVHPQDLPLYLSALDVCTLPLPSSDYFAFDSSPLKLFDYMASGVPIVSSDLPALREVLHDGENSILVSPDDPSSLAAGIRHVQQRPGIAGRIAKQARKDVMAHTWVHRARRIIGFIGFD